MRLGDAGATALRSPTPAGAGCGRVVRDAWVPSAGAAPRGRSGAPSRRASARRLRHDAAPDPARRAAGGARHRPVATARWAWPPGSAGSRCRARVRVLPPFTSRRFLPEKLARLRQIDGRGADAPARAGQRVRLAARIRARRRRARHRLAGHRPRARRGGAHLAPRAGPAHRAGHRHRPDVGRPDRRRAAPGRRHRRLPAARPRVAARAGDRVALVAADVRVRARLGPDRRAATCCPAWSTRSPPLRAGAGRDRSAAAGRRGAAPGRQARRWSCCSPASTPAADTGLLPAARALAARHQVVVASVADPAPGRAGRGPRPTSPTSTPPPPPNSPRAERREVASGWSRLGRARSSTRRRRRSPSQVADAYLDLKAAGRL